MALPVSRVFLSQRPPSRVGGSAKQDLISRRRWLRAAARRTAASRLTLGGGSAQVAPGFEGVRGAVERCSGGGGETGAAYCALVDGRVVVDLWEETGSKAIRSCTSSR